MAGFVTRRRIATGLLALGCLTTIATSAPDDHRLEATQTLEIAAGASVHLRLDLDEVAMDHARDNAEHSRLRFDVRGSGIRVVSDDETFPPAEPDGVTQFAGLDACPDSGGCTVGLTIESLGAAETITVTAGLTTDGDQSFLFPADRSYPDDATVTLTED